ncbi:MAG: hypothetical protein EBT03_08200 [Betaproteobacteria bacterium]|nr:hypothetical protein [Betaproteobacteria bacterium]
MKFRFVIYATQDRKAYAGFRDLLNAERYAELASSDWKGALLVLDTQTRQVLLSAKDGKLDFSPSHQYPL